MYAFYFFGINDIQDIGSTLLTSLKQKKNCWVCFFDCLSKKRQLFSYKEDELKLFIINLCKENDLPIPQVGFYGQKDEKAFEKDYRHNLPEIVFMQNAVHKYPLWYPIANRSRVVHFAWGQDSLNNLHRSKYNIVLNVLRNEADIDAYKSYSAVKSLYFGNMRLDQLTWKPWFSTLSSPPEDKKVCLIPEVWVTKHGKTCSGIPLGKLSKLLDKAINILHDKNYYVVWKKREKGHGSAVINTLLHLRSLPDCVIERDLNFPSALYHVAKISDVCLIYAPTGVQSDIEKIHNKTISLNSLGDITEELQKLTVFLEKEKTMFNLPQDSPASRLLRYVEEQYV